MEIIFSKFKSWSRIDFLFKLVFLFISLFFSYLEHGVSSHYPIGDPNHYWHDGYKLYSVFLNEGYLSFLKSLYFFRGWRTTAQTIVSGNLLMVANGSIFFANFIFTFLFTFASVTLTYRLFYNVIGSRRFSFLSAIVIWSFSWFRMSLEWMSAEGVYLIFFILFIHYFIQDRTVSSAKILYLSFSLSILIRPVESGVYLTIPFLFYHFYDLSQSNRKSMFQFFLKIVEILPLIILKIFFLLYHFGFCKRSFFGETSLVVSLLIGLIILIAIFCIRRRQQLINLIILSIPLIWYFPFIPGLSEWINACTSSIFVNYTGIRYGVGSLGFLSIMNQQFLGIFLSFLVYPVVFLGFFKFIHVSKVKFLYILLFSFLFFPVAGAFASNGELRYRMFFYFQLVVVFFVIVSNFRKYLSYSFVFFILILNIIKATPHYTSILQRSDRFKSLHVSFSEWLPFWVEYRPGLPDTLKHQKIAKSFHNLFESYHLNYRNGDFIFYLYSQLPSWYFSNLIRHDMLMTAFADLGYREPFLHPFLFDSYDKEEHLKIISGASMVIIGPLESEVYEYDLYQKVAVELLKRGDLSDLNLVRKPNLIISSERSIFTFAIFLKKDLSM
jgi:hypothetical protein